MNWLPDDKMIQALCWTLLHSLWQGLLLTIVTTILIILTRKSTATVRYNLLTALFLLFLVATACTFMHEFLVVKKYLPATSLVSASPEPLTGINGIQDNIITATSVELSFFDKVAQYFNTHASFIVLIWFILFSAKLVRILAGIGYIQRIRHHKTFQPPVYWKQRITELARRLDIQHSISLLESAIVKTPLVIGLLKPVILIPLGLLSNLPPEQVEAVLLHELAHIRRKDYLVNLLQNLAEMIFFFNPAVLWISSLLREERENCCDDIAISHTKNKKQFIHALVAFQEYNLQQANPGTLVAFTGQKKYLLNRVKRIIYNENKKLNAMEKGIFIFSIVALCFIGLVSMKQKSPQKKQQVVSTKSVLDRVPIQKEAGIKDTVPEPAEFKIINSVVNKEGNIEIKTITAIDDQDRKYKLIFKNNEPPELYVNDKKIPATEMDNYKKIVVAIEREAELRQKKDIEKMKLLKEEQNDKMMRLKEEHSLLAEKLKNLEGEQNKLNAEKMKELKEQEGENEKNLKLLNDQQMKLYKEGLTKQDNLKSLHNNEMELLQKKIEMNGLLQKKLYDQKLNELNDLQKKLILDHQSTELNDLRKNLILDHKYQELLNDKIAQLNGSMEQRQLRTFVLIQPIIEDLAEEQIISKDQEDISFELTNRSLTVNGKKQPSEVHERFKKKYLKKDSDLFKFSRKNGHTSTTINLD